MNVLQTIDLKKYYGVKPNITRALDGVNFSVEDGEFVAIVGTSGSGTSTLLNMMGGLDTPTSGTVIVRGEKLAKKNDEQLTIFRRRNIGFMLTSIFTRRREFAALQSVGMTGRQLLKMLRREGCTYVFLATAVAVPLSLMGTFQIIRPICKQIWFLNFKLELWPMLVMPILFLLFGLAIPYIAYRLISRQSITERLKAGE